VRAGVALAVLVAAAVGLVVLGAASASRTSTPVDGLILRADVTGGQETGGYGSVTACPSATLISRVRGPASAQTLAPSSSGWRDGRLPLSNAGGPLQIYSSNGGVVGVSAGWWLKTPDGKVVSFEMHAFVRNDGHGCVPLPSQPSAAGDVYQTNWQAYDCGASGQGVCSGTLTGDGCIALWSQGDRLVATMQVGACTPGAFPPVSATRPTSQDPLRIGTARSGSYFLYEGSTIKAMPAGTYRLIASTSDGIAVTINGPGVATTIKAGARNQILELTFRRGTYRYTFGTGHSARVRSFIVT
jgi:hypothetical protein